MVNVKHPISAELLQDKAKENKENKEITLVLFLFVSRSFITM